VRNAPRWLLTPYLLVRAAHPRHHPRRLAKYDFARRATMRFHTASQVVDDPMAVALALLQGVR